MVEFRDLFISMLREWNLMQSAILSSYGCVTSTRAFRDNRSMLQSMAVLTMFGLIAASGCDRGVSGDVGTDIAEGIYRGDRTCSLGYEDPELEEEIFPPPTVSVIIEVNDDGMLLLDGKPVYLGQVSTLDFGTLPVQLTVTHISMTRDSILIEADLLYTARYVDGSRFDYEGTGTIVIQAEGSDRITESISFVVTHHRDEYWYMSLSEECDSLLTK